MHRDARGLPVSTASAEAAAAFDHLVTGYLTYRADTPDRLNAVLEADPDFALAHCMKGYFGMLAFKQGAVPGAVLGPGWDHALDGGDHVLRTAEPEVDEMVEAEGDRIGWREAANWVAVGAL